MINLWTWIAVKTTAPAIDASVTATEAATDDVSTDGAYAALIKAQARALEQYTDGHDEACTELRIACEGNAYAEIEDMENAAEA